MEEGRGKRDEGGEGEGNGQAQGEGGGGGGGKGRGRDGKRRGEKLLLRGKACLDSYLGFWYVCGGRLQSGRAM
jgi:hypothetical protein